MSIEKNMLRDRALALPKITDEDYETFNEESREVLEEYLDSCVHLSAKSIKQYRSALRIFLKFTKDNLKNKPLYKITKRDYLKYHTFLQNHQLSSSALKFKKSAVSAFCKFIETFIAEDEENYKSFRNFTVGLPSISQNKVYEKVKISREEYEMVKDKLEESGNMLGRLWFIVAYETAARKGELLQFKSEIANYVIPEGKTYVDTHNVSAKGRGGGKILKYMLSREALDAIKEYVETRGFESEYLFSVKYKGIYGQISESWAGEFCRRILSPMLGRRINPHITRSSGATYLMERGVDVSIISKKVLHHESLEVTQAYLIRDEEEDKDSVFE